MAESTKERIINAAFSFYAVPCFDRVSLSQIAGKVGISKAAIFKHFKNKEALTQEMNDRVFTSLIEIFTPMSILYDRQKPGQAISYIVRLLLTHREYLFYLVSMSALFNENFVVNELRKRGVKVFDNVYDEDCSIKDIKLYVKYEFIGISVLYFVANRFHNECCNAEKLDSQDIFLESICYLLENGITNNKELVSSIDYSALNEKCIDSIQDVKPLNKMLKVIASIIDSVGITGLTVEKIAGALGMAKSSLYSSFENKVDMIKTLVENEFAVLKDLVRNNLKFSNNSYETLYIIMQTELCYFMERPELLLIFRNLFMNNSFVNDSFKKSLENHSNNDVFYDDAYMQDISSAFETDDVLKWIMFLPIMLCDSCQKNGVPKDKITESLIDIFMMVECGIKGDTSEEKIYQ